MSWLEYCKYCGRKHRMVNKLCPSCRAYETPQPESDKVLDKCGTDYSCDGCLAYREYTNPY